MIWILIILIIIVISFVLALRSMKNYQEVPTSKFPYELFLIKNKAQLLENGVINKLYDFSQKANAIISLERLMKGNDQALVLYAPDNINQFIPELDLLVIEDYLAPDLKTTEKRISLNHAVVWPIAAKSESELTVTPNFMQNFVLDTDQNFFLQLVLTASKNEFHFQVNIRAMIAESDVYKRVELAKRAAEYLKQESGLEKKQTEQPISTLFVEYQKRTIVPAEAEGFILSSQKIKQLI